MSHMLKTILFVAAFALLPMSAQAQKGKKPAAPAKGPFTGVWNTKAGGITFTVTLTQIGNKVTGTYTPYNGKIFGGVVTDDTVEFKWSQSNGSEGTGEFTLNDDRKGFTGTSTMIKPEPQINTWSTYVYVPEPPRSFAGTWDIVNNVGVRIPLTIVQQGAKVNGIYPAQHGKIEGTVDGSVLQFKWVSDKGSGKGILNISNSGQSLNVRFMNDKGQDVAGPAGLQSWGEPSKGKSSDDTGIDNNTKGGSGGKIVASFGGVWTVLAGGYAGGAMDVAQSDAVVTGIYIMDGRSYDVRDAKVNGMKLQFKIVALDGSGVTKHGEIVMDPDGKSFKGNVGGVPVKGTFARPS